MNQPLSNRVTSMGIALAQVMALTFILFGLMKKLTLQIELSSLKHGCGHAAADDNPSCLVSLSLKSESQMSYPG